jgi:hypothetical protein
MGQQKAVLKTTPELVICSEWKDWRFLPRLYRDREGWPKVTVFHWLCFWFQLTTEVNNDDDDQV